MASTERGVQLPSDTTASALLHDLLRKACDHFDDLSHVRMPESSKGFRNVFAEVVPAFEAARIASKDRSAIARRIALEAAAALVYRDEDGKDQKLTDYLAGQASDPLPLTVQSGTSSEPFALEVPCDGEVHRGPAVQALIDRLEAENGVTAAAAKALRWATQAELDLQGRKIVLLGAGAELAPTPLLLAAGADVLWIDITDPTFDPATHRGTLRHVKGGADLLTQPKEILATIKAFAGDDTVSIGMFAYAAGQGREWRLEAAMNAIANALPRGTVEAVGLYISPTSAASVQSDDAEAGERRKSTAPVWQRVLSKTGALGPAFAERGGKNVSRAIVPIQGASYQAAQYIAKALAAEAFATSRRIGKVSANVAGITNTRSMSLPVFQAGFVGAKLFGIRIFDTETTRWLSGLLLMHDWLNRDTESDDPQVLFERQIHGGVYTTGYQLIDVIKYAAIYGFARKPSLIAAMARGKA
jgi:hypothetical protein